MIKISEWWINPLHNSYAGPLMITLVVLFAGAGLALYVQQLIRQPVTVGGSNANQNTRQILWQRYCTWLIIAPIFAGAALSGPLTTAMMCALICWQGGHEYAALTGLPTTHFWAMVGGGWLTILLTLLFGPAILNIAPVIAIFGWFGLTLLPIGNETILNQRFTATLAGLWGWIYIGWLPAHLLALSEGKFPGFILLIGLGVAMSDIGAFCTGKAIGGPKLAPRLSPNKTWGGVIGNILGAAGALALVGFVLPNNLAWWQLLALALTIGLGSLWGDLLESLLKRQSGVKDAGGWLPGFGGLLDRIDSLLLVAPLVYYLSLLVF